MRFLAAFAVTTIFVPCIAVSTQGQVSPRVASEHFLIDHNRIFVELEFVRPDGTPRKALAYVDSGDPSFEFTAGLVRELGIDKGQMPLARFGGIELKVPHDIEASGNPGESMAAGMKVEANLPSTILDQYDVALDYGERTLTLAAPGTLHHEGVRIPCKVNRKTGLISVQAEVDGQSYAMTLDNGAAYTWIDNRVAKEWSAGHPGWLRGNGAVGDANMNGALPELTGMIMRLPAIDLTGLQINSIGALGVGPGWDKAMGRFFDWYSKKAPEPVVGFLGGNVLRAFRIEIDYANGVTYWDRENKGDPHDLNQVGIMIRPGPGGAYFVAAVATQNGRKMVDGVAPDDRLIGVDGAIMTGATMGKVLTALHGQPGTTRKLVLARGNKRFVVNARVTRF